MSSATLQDDFSADSFFNVVETETLALFEHLSLGFLKEFDVFAPAVVPSGQRVIEYVSRPLLDDCTALNSLLIP